MPHRFIHFIFFGNYFVGILAVILSIETCMQLSLPINNGLYYALLFTAPVFYYTFAYQKHDVRDINSNQRSNWYATHQRTIQISQSLFIIASIFLLFLIVYKYSDQILHLKLHHYVVIISLILACLFYYGLVSRKLFGFDLRKTGWLKAFIIGLVWACCTTVLPLIMLEVQSLDYNFDIRMWLWFFIKNWMFCSVNAIMFDIKDYPTDANQQLRTFVVRIGLRKTIYLILIPLLLAGLISFCFFAIDKNFSFLRFVINLIPFLATLIIALTLARRRPILYYLIVIDGIILLKGICGIIGSQF